MAYRIHNWDSIFENAASRKLKRLDWVAVPNKTDGEGYTALVDHPNGAAHLGAWYAIVEAASKQSPRGSLPAGIPQTVSGICRSLGRVSRLPACIFEEVIPRLVEIGWIEQLGEIPTMLAESADAAACAPAISGAHRREGNGREGNGTDTEVTSGRFDEWIEPWTRVADRDSAARNWISRVTKETVDAAFACRDRYLKSDEVARGVVMEPWKFIRTQADGGWAGKWPPARPSQQASREERVWEELANGTR